MFNIHSYFTYILQSSVIIISHGIIGYIYLSLYNIYYYSIQMIDIDICEQMVTLLLLKSSIYYSTFYQAFCIFECVTNVSF